MEHEREQRPADPLVRDDVQEALAVEGDLPEGGRSEMEQGAPNPGAREMPAHQQDEATPLDENEGEPGEGYEARP